MSPVLFLLLAVQLCLNVIYSIDITYNCKDDNNDTSFGILLPVNKQHLKTIDAGQLQYYALNVETYTHDLHIYITPIGNSDPDLLVSYSGFKCPSKLDETDETSLNPGAEHVIITYGQYRYQKYVDITIQGWTSGQYTILYRFIENLISNPLIINDNIPQFFMINADGNNSWALIDYSFAMTPNSQSILSLYLDSYAPNTVHFSVLIFGERPTNSNPNIFDTDHVLYSQINPSVTSLRLSSNDANVIQCRNEKQNTVVCDGFGNKVTQTITNNTAHVYMIIQIDEFGSEKGTKWHQLQITANTEIVTVTPTMNPTVNSTVLRTQTTTDVQLTNGTGTETEDVLYVSLTLGVCSLVVLLACITMLKCVRKTKEQSRQNIVTLESIIENDNGEIINEETNTAVHMERNTKETLYCDYYPPNTMTR